MKKPLTILLFISMLLQVSGYHLLFSLQQIQLKASAKRNLRRGTSKEQTEILEFSRAEWDQLPKEDDDEFIFHDRLYDVTDVAVSNGRVYVTCVADTRENELIDSYRELTRKDLGHKKSQKTAQLLKLFGNPFVKPGRLFFLPLIADKTDHTSFAYNHLSHPATEVITPPPRQRAA